MSKVTPLASGQITSTETITVELIEAWSKETSVECPVAGFDPNSGSCMDSSSTKLGLEVLVGCRDAQHVEGKRGSSLPPGLIAAWLAHREEEL